MAKKKTNQNLTEWEWTLTWSSLRYFCGRKTIASASYPADLVRMFGKRLTDLQKKMLSEDIKRSIEMSKGNSMWESIDMRPWSAMSNYFDESTWRILKCEGPTIETQEILAFPCEGRENEGMVTRWIPVEEYSNSGNTRMFVFEDYIKEIKSYNK